MIPVKLKSAGMALATFAAIALGAAEARASHDYGAACREYSTIITVGGRDQIAYGRACLQPDGSWKTVSAPQPRHHNLAPPPIPPRREVVYIERPPVVYSTRYYPVYHFHHRMPPGHAKKHRHHRHYDRHNRHYHHRH